VKLLLMRPLMTRPARMTRIMLLPWPPTGNRQPSPVAVKRPTLNMRVDADVLDAFKATGPGWQTRINTVLRNAIEHGVKAA
jgi:uncharacterized protein (DUF4415 family)